MTIAARRALIDTPPDPTPQSQCPAEITGSRHLDVTAAEKPAVTLRIPRRRRHLPLRCMREIASRWHERCELIVRHAE
jgi:hypothetical protein